MFDFLGKIPQEIIIACSGSKNSMAMTEFLSRTDRKIKLIHVDFKDEDSKERVQFVKTAAKLYKMDIDVIQPIRKIQNEYPDYYKSRELYDILTKYSPRYVLTATNLDDVVLHYLLNAIKCNPKIISYRSKNIIRPYINTPQEEFDHWIQTKKVGYFEEHKSKKLGQVDFIKKHMLDNCYKINPNIEENILNEVNRDFERFISNRKKETHD